MIGVDARAGPDAGLLLLVFTDILPRMCFDKLTIYIFLYNRKKIAEPRKLTEISKFVV